MTSKSVFGHTDYKAFLLAVEQIGQHKGFRTRIAECAGCQNAFVSQVLNGNVNFNLEQGLSIAAFLKLNTDERQYFLWMIELKRAGTSELKRYFSDLMQALRVKNSEIKERLQISPVLTSEAQAKYYSSWIYSAIHMGTMIPRLRSISKMAKALNLSEGRVSEAVDFLTKIGLLERKGNELRSGQIQIHLGGDSANANKQYTNWRIEAIKSLDAPGKNDMHYSGVSCLSKADVEKIKEIFVTVVNDYVRLVEKSPEETLYVFNLDFFRILTDS